MRDGHGVFPWADDVALEDLFLFQVANLELDVVTWTAIADLLLLVVDDVEDLAGEVRGLDCKSVAKTDCTLLDLAENNSAVALSHFVQDGDAKRSLSIARFDREVVKNLDEGRA